MSKVLQYKEPPFIGSVTFSDPLSLEQEAAIERANADLQNAMIQLGGPNNGSSAMMTAILPGLLACVERFSLAGIDEHPTVQNWPTRPRVAVVTLVGWLLIEVSKLYKDSVDTDAPNALPPQPMPTPAATENIQGNSTSSTASTGTA